MKGEEEYSMSSMSIVYYEVCVKIAHFRTKKGFHSQNIYPVNVWCVPF